ncbi:MAG TPA: lysophospholipid acyltransferase family protein [Phenylobacterium sp.]|uniref:lysophospholipid acyltransferase family protein n=1 Tax=Phenylobacterium sp. TaxID=1871053 RepID=UPI002B4685BA|nr:lysophospholipid acyltransferase family protein [Phenylobacterium sp.]HKR89971.1 lysophospholipid acyltransferase family protein [Phenylobacterium sp.]
MTAVRSALFAALFYLWSAGIAIACTPLLLGPPAGMLGMFRIYSRGIVVLLGLFGVRVEVRGREHIPQGAALVAPKHQCMFDVFAQFGVLPATAFVTKKELKWIPWFGWYGQRAGNIFVDRAGHSTALKKLVRDAKDRFAHGRQVVIFPEGTRTAPGAPGDYKPGIAALYREIDVPVHPVATNSGVHWSARGQRITPGTIVFEYLEPIPPGLKRAEFMRLLRERNETASERLLAKGL